MQISSIVDIVGGKLLTKPSISFITQIHTNPSKVNDGDLFIAKSQEDIDEALSNGAFAVIFDFECWMNDTEIAWIKVQDCSKALVNLTRFILSDKTLNSFYCDDISYEFLNIFLTAGQNYRLLSGDIFYDFKYIISYEEDKILFSNNKSYLNDILPLTKEFKIQNHIVENLTIHSLFQTSFSYNKRLFYKLKLSKLYLNQFLEVYKFLNEEVDLNRLKDFQYFTPLFINKHLAIEEFGKSNKFIIANNNSTLMDNQIKFLKTHYDYAKIAIIKKYKNNDELYKKIESLEFNALYIVGKSHKEILDIFNSFKVKSISLI